MIRSAARWVYDTLEAGINGDNDFVANFSLWLAGVICTALLALVLVIAWYISLIHPLLVVPYFATLGYLALATIRTNTDQENDL